MLYLQANESVLTTGPFKVEENCFERRQTSSIGTEKHMQQGSPYRTDWNQQVCRNEECSCSYCFSVCTFL